MAQLTLLKDPTDLFPQVENALLDPNGLLAIGGQISTERLTNAYAQGIFPWYNEGEPIMWWSPNPRCVLETTQFHISRSFSRFLKKRPYRVTINSVFSDVINHCAQPRAYEKETWINPAIIDAYTELHHQGRAHSIEVWHHDRLVGGIYGIFVANTFCGESMFSLMPNASKTGLYALSCWLKHRDIKYIDCQIPNPHLISLGASEITRREFVEHLSNNGKPDVRKKLDWTPQEIAYE